MRRLILLTAAAVLLAGCNKEEKITGNPGVNKWVHATLKSEYLWSSTLGDYSPSELAPNAYLETVRYRSDRTITDYMKDYYGDRFSAVERKGASGRSGETLAAEDEANDFGFATMSYVDNSGNIVYGQVIYVVPGSPADRAGIKRGYNYNAVFPENYIGGGYNMPMSYERFASLMSNKTVKLGIFYPETKTVTVTRATYADNPVIYENVYDTDQGKTAYLVYNHFTSGSGDRFGNDLKNVFAKFKREGVENLILDLRYNGGGELKAAVLLASLIARTSDLGKTLAYLERNAHKGLGYDRFDQQKFYSFQAAGAYNLNVKKLYIITLNYTASASELILHCLKPYFGDDLTHVGMKTYGKNVGSREVTNASYDWIIKPITMRVYDKNGVSGYEEGIPVDFESDEVHMDDDGNLYTTIGDFGQLGENPEVMLQKVIRLMNTGHWAATFRSADGMGRGSAGYRNVTSDVRERGLMEEGAVLF